MIKIAVQLYGHLRTFKTCAPALKKHILDHYDADVFIHTWDKTEHNTQSWYKNQIRSKVMPVDKDLMLLIEDLYSPVTVKVETQNLFDEKGHFGTHDDIKISLQGMKYMTYSQYQVNQLREKYQSEYNVEYDYVVMIRPDVMPFVKLDFGAYEAEFEFNKNVSIHFIHNSEIKMRSNKVFNYPLVADCFYFSRPEIISKITSLFQDFDYYYKDILKIFPKQIENPEVSFFESIYQKGIIPRQYINYFAIKRHSDKDSIKLLPPDINLNCEGYKEGIISKIVKKTLRIIAARFPVFVTKKLISIFELLGSCGHYLKFLEQRR